MVKATALCGVSLGRSRWGRGFACCPRRTVKGAFARLSPPSQGVWPDLGAPRYTERLRDHSHLLFEIMKRDMHIYIYMHACVCVRRLFLYTISHIRDVWICAWVSLQQFEDKDPEGPPVHLGALARPSNEIPTY